jgi:elongation factor P hydroxylase
MLHPSIHAIEAAVAACFPQLTIIGGADEPFYQAPSKGASAILFYREDFPRSLLHELAHYCLAGPKRRALDDFGFWYLPSGRTAADQTRFEVVEARPQGLERRFCEIVGLAFEPSLDDFSGRPPSLAFLEKLESAYIEMKTQPPTTASDALMRLQAYVDTHPDHFVAAGGRV